MSRFISIKVCIKNLIKDQKIHETKLNFQKLDIEIPVEYRISINSASFIASLVETGKVNDSITRALSKIFVYHKGRFWKY